MITGAYTVVRCLENVHPNFVYYYYLSLDEKKCLRPLYTGLRKVIRPNTFLSAKMPLPSFREQVAIAEYLDRKTQEIDVLVEKELAIIGLLQELRTSLISEAVTGKIDVRESVAV